MQVAASRESQQSSATARAFLEQLLSDYHPRDFAVRFWDEASIDPDAGQPARFTLVIHSGSALHKMFHSPNELNLGEAYIYNDFDIEGDVEAAFQLGLHLMNHKFTVGDRLRLGALLRRVPSNHTGHEHHAPDLKGMAHSRDRDQAAVSYHYDTSNDFFSLFLGKTMIYSEAYFEDGDMDLDSAQKRQLERICQALRLKAGERFLDIGCGWGSLMIHAAKNFGVKATGITLSKNQAQLTTGRLEAAGLGDSCAVAVCDYRDLNAPEPFDKISSIGMFEHVGHKRLSEYFRRVRQLLRPGGSFLNSGISRPIDEPAKRPGSFSDKYVFPDGELIPIGEITKEAESAGFEIRTVENLREQYGLTLRHWLSRLELYQAEARQLVGDVTYRIWRLYMAASAARFFAGKLNTYQVLMVKR